MRLAIVQAAGKIQGVLQAICMQVEHTSGAFAMLRSEGLVSMLRMLKLLGT
jgi:hypothetical protein